MSSEDVIELGSSDDDAPPPPKKKPALNAMVHIPGNVSSLPGIKTVNSGNQSKNIKIFGITGKQVAAVPNLKVKILKKLPPNQLLNPLAKTGMKVKKIQESKLLRKLPPGITVTKTDRNIAKSHTLFLTKVKHKQNNTQVSKKLKSVNQRAAGSSKVVTVELDDENITESTSSTPQWYLKPEEQNVKDSKCETDIVSLEEQNNMEPEPIKCIEIIIEDSPAKPIQLKHLEDASSAILIEDSPVKIQQEDKQSKKKLKYDSPTNSNRDLVEIEIDMGNPKSDNDVDTKNKQCSENKLNLNKSEPENSFLAEASTSNYVKPPEKICRNKSNLNKSDPEISFLSEASTSNYVKPTEEICRNKSNLNKSEPEISTLAEASTSNYVKPTEKICRNKSNLNKSEPEISTLAEASTSNYVKPTEKICRNKSNLNKSEPEISTLAEASTSNYVKPTEKICRNKSNLNKSEPEISSLAEASTSNYVKPTEKICSEFTPVYQKFIDTCLLLENTEDMTQIVERKVKGYYLRCPKEYVESEEFTDLVSGKILSMKNAPVKRYMFIKAVVDELKMQRKLAESVPPKVQEENEIEPEHSEHDEKRQRQIRKLEKTLKKLHRAIQKLDEQEVDFEDEDDSVYLLAARYQERLVRVHAKFCQLTNTKMPSEPKIVIASRPGRSTAPAKKIEKWINRKVPIGTPLPFPDFHDVLKCVREANKEEKLGWNEIEIMEEARDLFTRCGKKLQRRRQENEWRIASSRLSVDNDPAEQNESLKKKLDENKLLASNEDEVLNKFASKQSSLMLEAEEIGDREAEESPLESEEEDEGTSNSLENKDKRKNRIKRLINDKSKRDSEVMENSKDLVDTKTDKESGPIKENKNNKNDDKIENEDRNKISMQNENANVGDQNTSKAIDLSSEKDVSSDVDELNLLQKLYSENEENPAVDSSNSESPIPISDSISSESETEDKPNEDIISIENSSYSEAEQDIDAKKSISPADNILVKNENIVALKNTNIEFECSVGEASTSVVQLNDKMASKNVLEEIEKSNMKEEVSGFAKCDIKKSEEILSGESESNSQNGKEMFLMNIADDSQSDIDSLNEPNTPVNLGDDNISISETCIGNIVAPSESSIIKSEKGVNEEDYPYKNESNSDANNILTDHLKSTADANIDAKINDN
ncbi:uncharacterized protein LOC126965657 isoform X2 [Leptidea sinapis]|uniref:uncharacterized protein LOC126965657 isoform X2 n=1 Tax=Leptidea sinapis TaxID=189913 RepID=UPI0021C2C892|nr:uncharacterized protein LOC126965657 isoform X2 [Leptidea sinapis]